MEIEHARKWADALYFGTHEKMRGRMSNSKTMDEEPTAMCCLCVLSETLKPEGYKEDRTGTVPYWCTANTLKDLSPKIFGEYLSDLNDGFSSLVPEMSHKEIAFLIDLAIESGEIEGV